MEQIFLISIMRRKNNMERVDLALETFKDGFNCAQSVLFAFAEDFGLDRKIALRIAGAFGGGIGRMGNICGAVSGSFMVIGLKHSKLSAEDNVEREKGYKLVRLFVEIFKEKNGSIICKDLLGYDMSIPEEFKIIKEKNLTGILCPKFVRSAVEILSEILKKENV